MSITRCDQYSARCNKVSVLGLSDFDIAYSIKPPGHHCREALRHVLDHDYSGANVSRKAGQQVPEGIGSTRGGPDCYQTPGTSSGHWCNSLFLCLDRDHWKRCW